MSLSKQELSKLSPYFPYCLLSLFPYSTKPGFKHNRDALTRTPARPRKAAMFGFSIQKLLFTVAVVLAVWYGFKWVGRMKVIREKEAKERLRRDSGGFGGGGASSVSGDAEDMVECALCGAFVPIQGAKDCGRGDCPYGG